MAFFEPKFCEEALNYWYNGIVTTSKRQLSLKAKQHLSAIGWGFWYAEKNGKRELRYQSPEGKIFYSLRTACESVLINKSRSDFLKEIGVERVLVVENKSRKRKRKSKGDNQLSRDQPSAKRVREDSVSTCSHRQPRNVLSKLIDNNVVSALAKVFYRDKQDKPLREGRITREGIQCSCCFRVFGLTAFEVHAGSSNHRPSANIILDDGSGRSLADCQRQLSDSMIKSSRVESPKTVKEISYQHEYDGVCSGCLDGGELICCDQCPSTFHLNCVGLKQVPDGDWFCPFCCCGICGIAHDHHSALVTCQQCDFKFHVGCLRRKESSDFKNYQSGKSWYCSRSCENIFSALQKLLGKSIAVGNNLHWTLLKSAEHSDTIDHLGHGIDASAEIHAKLSVALDVMHECFETSKDSYTRRDLVEDVIFSRGSNLKRVNFKGFYTVILEENDDMVTVANVRVHGNRAAEMPFVATRFRHRRRGMCRLLVDELERILMELGVEKLVLPSIRSALGTWTKGFGFSPMTDEERAQLAQYTILDFLGTTMCQKQLLTVID